jgi:hypothetical protein
VRLRLLAGKLYKPYFFHAVFGRKLFSLFHNVHRTQACSCLVPAAGMKQCETVQHEATAVQTAVLHPTKNLEGLDPAILVLKRTSESSIPDSDCHVTSSLTDENSNVVTTTKKTLRRPFSRHVHKSRIFFTELMQKNGLVF